MKNKTADFIEELKGQRLFKNHRFVHNSNKGQEVDEFLIASSRRQTAVIAH